MPEDILVRHPANPILTAAGVPGGPNSVFSGGLAPAGAPLDVRGHARPGGRTITP